MSKYLDNWTLVTFRGVSKQVALDMSKAYIRRVLPSLEGTVHFGHSKHHMRGSLDVTSATSFFVGMLTFYTAEVSWVEYLTFDFTLHNVYKTMSPGDILSHLANAYAHVSMRVGLPSRPMPGLRLVISQWQMSKRVVNAISFLGRAGTHHLDITVRGPADLSTLPAYCSPPVARYPHLTMLVLDSFAVTDGFMQPWAAVLLKQQSLRKLTLRSSTLNPEDWMAVLASVRLHNLKELRISGFLPMKSFFRFVYLHPSLKKIELLPNTHWSMSVVHSIRFCARTLLPNHLPRNITHLTGTDNAVGHLLYVTGIGGLTHVSISTTFSCMLRTPAPERQPWNLLSLSQIVQAVQDSTLHTLTLVVESDDNALGQLSDYAKTLYERLHVRHLIVAIEAPDDFGAHKFVCGITMMNLGFTSNSRS
jgi:hypothetical protein